MIKAALFDFDGVVVDSEPLHYRTFMKVLGPYGVHVDFARWYMEFAGTGSRKIIEKLVREYGIKTDVDGLVQKRKKIYEGCVRSGELKEKEGIQEFLMQLDKRGIKKAIVSGSHRTNVQAAMDVLGLGGFDVIVTGEDTVTKKPDPGPFLFASQELKTKPSECIVFEDSVAGSVAAKRAMMKLVVIESPALPNITGYELAIKDFRQDLEKILPLLS